MIFPRVPELVSVVIPSYNYAAYVTDCLNSIQSQTYSHIEIILVDDQSTDNTVRIVENWRDHVKKTNQYPPNLTILQLPHHIGYAGALTIGFFLTDGEFIAVQDLDDISHPNRIQKQVELINNTDVDIIGTNVAQFKDGDFNTQTVADWIEYGSEIKDSYNLGRPVVCTSTILFRGVFFDFIGGLTRRTWGMEDSEFIVKCMSNGATVDNIPEVLYYAREHTKQRVKWIQSHLQSSGQS